MVSQQAVPWLLFIYAERTGGTNAAAAMVLAFAITTPIFVMANMGLTQMIVVSNSTISEIYGPCFWLRTVAVSGAVVLSLIIGTSIGIHPAVFGSVLLYKTLDTFTDILLAPAHKNRRFSSIGLSQSLRGVVSVGLLGILFATGQSASVATVAAALVIATILPASLHWRSALETPGPIKGQSQRIRRLAFKAVPLVGIVFLAAISASVPRYAISALASNADLARFGACRILSNATNSIGLAATQAMLPGLAKLSPSDRRPKEVMRVSLNLLPIGLSFVGASVFLPASITEFLYGEASPGRSLQAFIGIVAAVRLIGDPWRIALLAFSTFFVRFRIEFVAAVVGLVVTFALVEPLGGVGAAVGLLVGALTAIVPSIHKVWSTTRS